MTGRVALVAAALLSTVAGCAAPGRTVYPPLPTSSARPAPRRALPIPLAASEFHEEPEVVGVTHVVRRGETLYRIAHAYGLSPSDLAETNGIVDPRQVAVGTELFVPGASRTMEVEPAPAPPPERPGGERAAVERGATSIQQAPPPREGEPDGPLPRPTARLAWPLRGVLYGRFGVRSGRRHDGIDVAAPEGTVIAAAADGQVIYAGEQSGYGSIAILRHEGGLVTLYAHCSAILVEEGAAVRGGAPIARVGQTGRTTGPHLHFEVREGTRPRNPLLFLP